MLKFCSSNRSAKTRRLEASNRKITKRIVIEKEKERERGREEVIIIEIKKTGDMVIRF